MGECMLNPAVRTLRFAKFKEFVERVLSGREASFLDKFLIRFPRLLDKGGYSDFVSTCVSSAVKLNPRAFSMVDFIPSTDLLAIFTCESIEELCLTTRFCNINYNSVIPAVINLPRIRRLQLKMFKLDERSISSIFSGCPVLEELLLEDCLGDFSCVFSSKLKHLSLCECELELPFSKRTVDIESCLLGDTAESLISSSTTPLELLVQFIWKTQSNTSAVDNAFSFMRNFFHRVDLGDHLGGLSSVTVLKLHVEQKNLKVLEEELQKLGEFHYLKDLLLSGWCMTGNFSPVALFLQKSPNLQKLDLYNCGEHCQGEKISVHQMVDSSMFVKLSRCKNLKAVDIRFWKDHIRAHEIEEAVLLCRKEFENIEVVLSEQGAFFW